jgi:hypothetical protein
MRSVLMALVALALLGLNASASVPDPDYCTVQPPDSWAYPKLVGIPSDVLVAPSDGRITVHVAAYGGTPIANCEVLVVINAECGDLTSQCDSWGNPVYTDLSGNVNMTLRFGGCCQMDAAATIYADGTPIRTYTIINSPDWNGLDGGDGRVLLADFGEFAANYGGTDLCSDYLVGEGQVLLADFGLFASYYGKSCVVTP